jgi:hypothetical protein
LLGCCAEVLHRDTDDPAQRAWVPFKVSTLRFRHAQSTSFKGASIQVLSPGDISVLSTIFSFGCGGQLLKAFEGMIQKGIE